MTVYQVVAGWTAAIDIDLLSAGATPSGIMSAMTAQLILRDLDGNTLNTTGDVTIPDINVWSVRYTPDAADLVPGVYRGRVKITDGSGGVAYFPSGDPDIWEVKAEA